MKSILVRGDYLCVVVFLFALHCTEIALAAYESSDTTEDSALSREPDDSDETQQSVLPRDRGWGNWRKLAGSDIEQRTEVEAAFGNNPIGGSLGSAGNDKFWVAEPFEKPADFDDDRPVANVKTSGIEHIKYKTPVPVKSSNPDTAIDKKKSRQKKILVPFDKSRTSNVASYDEKFGVQCPDVYATGQFVYPPDCKFFVDCHRGRASVQPCAPGTLFNPDTLECDFFQKVRCYGGEIADFPNSNYTEINGPREPLVKLSQGYRQYRGHPADDNLPTCRPQQTGYLAHPSDCTKFIQCANGGTFTKDCGPGTVFNPVISVCDWPYNVKGCEDAFKKKNRPAEILTPPEPHSHGKYRTNPTGSWEPISETQENVKKIECPPGSSGLLPHPDTCKKFLQCANDVTYIMDCGPGTAFNPLISVCDWPYNVPGCSEDRRAQDPTESDHRPYQPIWNPPTSGDRVIQNGQAESYDRIGSASQQHGEPVNGHQEWQHRYQNRESSRIGNQWQPGQVGEKPSDHHATGGPIEEQPSGHRQPTFGPSRPSQNLPGDWNSHEIVGEASSHHNQYDNHHQHHNDDGSGHWYHSGPVNLPKSDEERMAGVPPMANGQSNGWEHLHHHDHDHHHHRHDGPGPWDHPEHDCDEQDEGRSLQPLLTPNNNHNGRQPGNHYHQGGYNHHRHPHDDGHVNWNPGNRQITTDNPNTAYPNGDRAGYGRMHPNFPVQRVPNRGTYESWKPSPVAPTTIPSGTRWNNGNGNPTWNHHGSGTVVGDRMIPSQPEPKGMQSGVFRPSSWRGQSWTEPGSQNLKPIPTLTPNSEENKGDDRYPPERRYDDRSSRTNLIQHGVSEKDEDTKMDDWKSKTNIVDAQRGIKQGLKTPQNTRKTGPSGIHVNVNGIKGHYITKEIEINEGHSNMRNYGRVTTDSPPSRSDNHYDRSHANPGSIGWITPINGTYPNNYEPIRSTATNNRWIPVKYDSVNEPGSESIPEINEQKYEKYPTDSIKTDEPKIFTTKKPVYVTFKGKKIDHDRRTNSGVELSTVSIEPKRDNGNYKPKSMKATDTKYFGDIVEPNIDKYEVDVLDAQHTWRPKLTFENKTKKSNDNSVIMSINKKNLDFEIFDVKLASWQEDEPPFPVYYMAPVHPVDSIPKPNIMVPASGQILRLRGGANSREGYLEVQGIHPGWGIVCDSRNDWTLNEAHVVCRQLGYTRGAEMAWQGRSQWDESEIPWIAATEVNCQGNETRFQTCKFVHGDECRIKRDAVGIRCMANRAAYCRKDEIAHGGQCYHLASPDSALNHAEALEHCVARKSHLVDITSQPENDFLSEWLIQTYSDVTSIMTSGVGFTTFNRTLWLWEDSTRAKFQFSKWWPGWMNDRQLPPWAGSRPACIVMKKKFPCHARPETDCPTDYFFWDIEDCASTMKGHSYVCERPYSDISCVYGKGQQYAGSANVSVSGEDCLPWNHQSLAHILRVNVLNQEVREELMVHNYCRNPNPMNETRPWCFIGVHGEREYCDIPPCGNTGTKRSLVDVRCKAKHFECSPGECIPSPWVCDGEEDCRNGLDEKGCSSHLEFFKKIKDHKLEGHDFGKWLNTPPTDCALRCKKADMCRSFSHESKANVCFLSDSNVGASGNLRPDIEFDYYEMIHRSIDCQGMFVCGNKKCINDSQVCDGKNDCGDRTDENICTVKNLDYDIRLAGSNNSYEGRVEVKVLGHWGQVCDNGFGLIDANVVCKELGFDLGALEVRTGAYYGNLDPPERFLVDGLKCRGNESSLRECDFDGWGVHKCLPEQAVGIVCKSTVNTCQLGHWKCDTDATCIPVPLICDKVVDCPDGADENPIHCDAPFELRLANGSSPLEGRVEIRHHGIWGTICDDDFHEAVAKVVCRSLGHGGSAIPKKKGFFGPGDGPIWLDEMFCHGTESQLSKCRHNGWARNDCDHNEDAGVICTHDSVKNTKTNNH